MGEQTVLWSVPLCFHYSVDTLRWFSQTFYTKTLLSEVIFSVSKNERQNLLMNMILLNKAFSEQRFCGAWLICWHNITQGFQKEEKALWWGCVSIATRRRVGYHHTAWNQSSQCQKASLRGVWSAHSKKSNSVVKKTKQQSRALQYIYAAGEMWHLALKKRIGPYYIQCKTIITRKHHREECMRSVWLKVNQDFKM